MSDNCVVIHAMTFVKVQVQPAIIRYFFYDSANMASTKLFQNQGIFFWVPHNDLNNIVLSVTPNENTCRRKSTS